MRFHLSLSLAAALAVASVVPATAGSLVDPIVDSGAAVAPAPTGSLGGLGAGAVIGLVALLAIAAASGSSSSAATTN